MADIAIIAPGPLALLAKAIECRARVFFPENQFGLVWLPARVTPKAWNALVKKYPTIGLCFASFGRGESQSDLTGPSHWQMVVATKNPNRNTGQMFGDATSPGLLTMLGAAGIALHGFTIPGFGSVKVSELTHAMIEQLEDEDVAIGTVDFTVNTGVRMAEVVSGDLTQADPMATLNVQWSFDGGATTALTDEVNQT
jgi:hypothetical protein